MKVSNKKSIEKLGLFLMFMLILDLTLIGMQWLIVRQPDQFIITLLILFIALVIYMTKLKYTEFENSGFVISIKKKHLLNGSGFVFPLLEFPSEIIKDCKLKSQVIYLQVLNSTNSKKKVQVFRISLAGFDPNEQKEILNQILNDKSKLY
ncbi:MAG: hypothetical protein BGO86_06385 [Chryseobacterium sp. 36-9]|nr:MAG: hypothetical protein BGO86_06385 [Chryseobacterium sp. 36-9]